MNRHLLIYMIQDFLLRFSASFTGPILYREIYSKMSSNTLAYSSIIVSSIIMLTSLLFNKFDKILYKYYIVYILVDIVLLFSIIGLRFFNIISNDLFYILINAEVATTVMLIIMSTNIKKSYFSQDLRKRIDNYTIVSGNSSILLGSILSLIISPSLGVSFLIMLVLLISDNLLVIAFIRTEIKD